MHRRKKKMRPTGFYHSYGNRFLIPTPTHELLDDVPSSENPEKVSSTVLNSCTRDVAGSVDPNVISSRGSLLSPSMDQNTSLCTHRVQTLKRALDPSSKSWASDAAGIDKENISPLTPSNGRQRLISTLSPPISVSHSNQLDPAISSGLPSIQTLLPMTLCDQTINFDLQDLDDDPCSIIELLSATSSDRDKWMIVGAFYRRKGNIHAALTVVTTMVKGQQDLTRRFRTFLNTAI